MMSSNDLSSIEEHCNRQFFLRRVGIDGKIYIVLVVEVFRFVFYFWFLLIIIVSVILTDILVETEYKKILKSIYGYVDLCAYLQSPSAIYVIPALYAVYPIITFFYIATSVFWAWVSKQENNIYGLSFRLYICAFIWLLQAVLLFNLMLSVQHDTKNSLTIIAHRWPFTNLVVGITLIQIETAWFNCTVCCIESDKLKYMPICNYVSITILLISSLIVIINHINFIGGFENGKGVKRNGLLWDATDETICLVCQVNESIWVLFAFVIPLLESGYLTWKNFYPHGVIITVEANKNIKGQYNPVPGNFWDGGNYSNDTSDFTF